ISKGAPMFAMDVFSIKSPQFLSAILLGALCFARPVLAAATEPVALPADMASDLQPLIRELSGSQQEQIARLGTQTAGNTEKREALTEIIRTKAKVDPMGTSTAISAGAGGVGGIATALYFINKFKQVGAVNPIALVTSTVAGSLLGYAVDVWGRQGKRWWRTG